MSKATVLQVNLAVPEKSDAKNVGITGINKQPVDHPVAVRAPGPKKTGLHSGLVGDQIFDIDHHGGDDQAVYAYAREDYDWWERRLGRTLPGGVFGDNLTTADVDVSGAVTTVVSRAALDAGAVDVVLFTDLANATSNALYQRLGYRPVEDRAIVEFR